MRILCPKYIAGLRAAKLYAEVAKKPGRVGQARRLGHVTRAQHAGQVARWSDLGYEQQLRAAVLMAHKATADLTQNQRSQVDATTTSPTASFRDQPIEVVVYVTTGTTTTGTWPSCFAPVYLGTTSTNSSNTATPDGGAWPW